MKYFLIDYAYDMERLNTFDDFYGIYLSYANTSKSLKIYERRLRLYIFEDSCDNIIFKSDSFNDILDKPEKMEEVRNKIKECDYGINRNEITYLVCNLYSIETYFKNIDHLDILSILERYNNDDILVALETLTLNGNEKMDFPIDIFYDKFQKVDAKNWKFYLYNVFLFNKYFIFTEEVLDKILTPNNYLGFIMNDIKYDNKYSIDINQNTGTLEIKSFSTLDEKLKLFFLKKVLEFTKTKKELIIVFKFLNDSYNDKSFIDFDKLYEDSKFKNMLEKACIKLTKTYSRSSKYDGINYLIPFREYIDWSILNPSILRGYLSTENLEKINMVGEKTIYDDMLMRLNNPESYLGMEMLLEFCDKEIYKMINNKVADLFIGNVVKRTSTVFPLNLESATNNDNIVLFMNTVIQKISKNPNTKLLREFLIVFENTEFFKYIDFEKVSIKVKKDLLKLRLKN